jgi:hypothetical protein
VTSSHDTPNTAAVPPVHHHTVCRRRVRTFSTNSGDSVRAAL